MPNRQIIIDFDFPEDEQLAADQSLVARIRALGEDLYREFSRNGQAIISIHEVDSATDRLSLTLSSNHHTGDVMRFIKKQLTRHHLGDIAHISKS